MMMMMMGFSLDPKTILPSRLRFAFTIEKEVSVFGSRELLLLPKLLTWWFIVTILSSCCFFIVSSSRSSGTLNWSSLDSPPSPRPPFPSSLLCSDDDDDDDDDEKVLSWSKRHTSLFSIAFWFLNREGSWFFGSRELLLLPKKMLTWWFIVCELKSGASKWSKKNSQTWCLFSLISKDIS